jgi:hypothetical protein
MHGNKKNMIFNVYFFHKYRISPTIMQLVSLELVYDILILITLDVEDIYALWYTT